MEWSLEGYCGLESGPPNDQGLGREKLIEQRVIPGAGKSWLWRNVHSSRGLGPVPQAWGTGDKPVPGFKPCLLVLGQGARGLGWCPAEQAKENTDKREKNAYSFLSKFSFYRGRTKGWEGWSPGAGWQARNLSFLCQPRRRRADLLGPGRGGKVITPHRPRRI